MRMKLMERVSWMDDKPHGDPSEVETDLFPRKEADVGVQADREDAHLATANCTKCDKIGSTKMDDLSNSVICLRLNHLPRKWANIGYLAGCSILWSIYE